MSFAEDLKRVHLFAGLDTAQRAHIADYCYCRPKVYHGRHQLFEAGDEAYELYLMIRGAVIIYTEQTTLNLLGPGDHFGEMALANHNRRCASAATFTQETELRILNLARFRELLYGRPDLNIGMFHSMAQRLRQANDQLAEIRKSAMSRVARQLLWRADMASGHLCPPLTQEQLADLIHVRCRETVARALEKLEVEQGCIRRDGGDIVVTDRARLERIAELSA